MGRMEALEGGECGNEGGERMSKYMRWRRIAGGQRKARRGGKQMPLDRRKLGPISATEP